MQMSLYSAGREGAPTMRIGIEALFIATSCKYCSISFLTVHPRGE
jgi:hypothetical protein